MKTTKAKTKCFVAPEKKKTTFYVEATYRSLPDERDLLLGRAVGRPSDGSGYGFGGRDNVWYYVRRTAAEAAVKRIRAAKIRGVRVELHEDKA